MILECLLDILEQLIAVGLDQPRHLEIFVRIDRAILGGQIAVCWLAKTSKSEPRYLLMVLALESQRRRRSSARSGRVRTR